MKKSLVLGAVTLAAMSAGSVFAGTADDVKARGKVKLWCFNRCTWVLHSPTLTVFGRVSMLQFAAPLPQLFWVMATAVEFVPTTGKTRFTARLAIWRN